MVRLYHLSIEEVLTFRFQLDVPTTYRVYLDGEHSSVRFLGE